VCPVVILSDRGSGQTTFLGLLYDAQTRYATQAPDRFRFHAPRASLLALSAAYQDLRLGKFPSESDRVGSVEIQFFLAYRSLGLPRLLAKLARKRNSGSFESIEFLVPGKGLSQSPVAASALPDLRYPGLFRCDGFLLLVDGGKLLAPEGSVERERIRTYDASLAKLLRSLRDRPEDDRAPLYPVFVFLKFDSVLRSAFRSAKLKPMPPPLAATKERQRYGEALLQHDLPQTLAEVRSEAPRGAPFAPPAYFFSSIRTAVRPGKPPRIVRVTRTLAEWEIDYSYPEYEALLAHFRTIAGDIATGSMENEG
jgi:hypothetical protein